MKLRVMTISPKDPLDTFTMKKGDTLDLSNKGEEDKPYLRLIFVNKKLFRPATILIRINPWKEQRDD